MPDGFLDRYLKASEAKKVKRNVFTSRAYDALKRLNFSLKDRKGGYSLAADVWDTANTV